MMTEIQDPHFDIIQINGGSALLFGIYRYHRHKIYKNGSSIWRCSTYKNTKCCGSITIAKVATYNYIYFLNVLLLIWPKWLCYDWSMGCIQLIQNFTDSRMILVGLMFSYGILFIRAIKNVKNIKNKKIQQLYRVILLAVSLAIIPFLPASNILYPVGFVIAERILYIPSAGFCFLLVIGFRLLLYKRSLITCKIGVFMFLLLLLIFSVQSWLRSLAWQNEYNLFISALAVCPLNAKVHYNVAKAADANHETTWALAEYKEAIRLYPEYYQAMNNLANILKNQKQFDEAEYYLQEAVTYKRDFPAAWMNLGIVLANTGRFNESEEAYRTAISYRKKYPDCYYNLGNLYLELNRTEDAINNWLQSIYQNPKHVLAWTNLMALMDNTGQIERALKIIPKALTELPDAPSINFAIANMYGKLNRFGEAETHFMKAIKLLDVEVQALHYANLDLLENTIDNLNKMFHTRITQFEADLQKQARTPSNITSLVAEFTTFRSFMLEAHESLQQHVKTLARSVDHLKMQGRHKFLFFHSDERRSKKI